MTTLPPILTDRHYREYQTKLQIKWNDQTVDEWEIDLEQEFEIPLKKGTCAAVIKLYDAVCDFDHLLAVGAPVRWKGEME